MKLVEVNWFGFDHAKVAAKFSGGLTYVRTFSIKGQPYAVYRAAKPDRAKGHKKYMLLTKHYNGGSVSGMSAQQIRHYKHQPALHCHNCDELVYSVARHHYHQCSCGRVAIDGGDAYTRVAIADGAKFNWVTLDLLTGEIKKAVSLPKQPSNP